MVITSRWIHAGTIVAICLAITGCGPATFVVGAAPGDQQLKAAVVQTDGVWFADRVAMIDITGLIHNANKPQLIGHGENPVSLLHERLQKARRDPRVRAVVLRINSPGGTVTASDVMYRMITDFKQQTGKPVVALMMDVAASGGYYVACAADRIVAHPTTVTGSIGVLVQTVTFKTAMDRLGIHAEAITSGPNKAVGSPLGPLTDEHRRVLQSLVDDFYQRFEQVVHRARPGIAEQDFARITDGRVVSGEVAHKAGLVDQTGDLDDAFDLAKHMAGIQQADLVVYHRPLQYVGSPYAHAQALHAPGDFEKVDTQINLAQINLQGHVAFPTPGFYYVWCSLP